MQHKHKTVAATRVTAATKIAIGAAAAVMFGLAAYGFGFIPADFDMKPKTDKPAAESAAAPAEIERGVAARPSQACVQQCADTYNACKTDGKEKLEACMRMQDACVARCQEAGPNSVPPSDDTARTGDDDTARTGEAAPIDLEHTPCPPCEAAYEQCKADGKDFAYCDAKVKMCRKDCPAARASVGGTVLDAFGRMIGGNARIGGTVVEPSGATPSQGAASVGSGVTAPLVAPATEPSCSDRCATSYQRCRSSYPKDIRRCRAVLATCERGCSK